MEFRQRAGWQAIYGATLLIAIGMLVAFLLISARVGAQGLFRPSEAVVSVEASVSDEASVLLSASLLEWV
jgi:hypothetical protein